MARYSYVVCSFRHYHRERINQQGVNLRTFFEDAFIIFHYVFICLVHSEKLHNLLAGKVNIPRRIAAPPP